MLYRVALPGVYNKEGAAIPPCPQCNQTNTVRALAYSIFRYAAICHITVDNGGHNFVRYATKVGISGESDMLPRAR